MSGREAVTGIDNPHPYSSSACSHSSSVLSPPNCLATIGRQPPARFIHKWKHGPLASSTTVCRCLQEVWNCSIESLPQEVLTDRFCAAFPVDTLN